jgi:hypothetical protein
VRRSSNAKGRVNHSVVDVERWLKGKAERAAAIGSAGTNVTDYVASDGSSNVAVTLDVHDMKAAQELLSSPPPEARTQAEAHGVLPPITVYIEA